MVALISKKNSMKINIEIDLEDVYVDEFLPIFDQPILKIIQNQAKILPDLTYRKYSSSANVYLKLIPGLKQCLIITN